MKVKRRFPNFFEGFEITEHEVNNLDELLEIDWIKAYDEIPNHLGMFYSPGMTYYPRHYEDSPDLLVSLSIDKNGTVIYFVVGYIFGNGKDLGLEDYINYVK